MFKKRMIFWDQERQKIRFSNSNNFSNITNYSFIGLANENEFEILLQVLFEKFGDELITTPEVIYLYEEFMDFLKNLKRTVKKA
tara:strand:+ start:1484 stop:1735 length:252 start_codon:yes stop_codon:yes gene_type:complete